MEIVTGKKIIRIDGEEVEFDFDKDSYCECHVPENDEYLDLRKLLRLNACVKEEMTSNEKLLSEEERGEYPKLRVYLVKKYNLDTKEIHKKHQ